MKTKILALFASVAVLSSLPVFGYVVIEDKCSLKICTPSLSERQTRKLRLGNGLEAYLISDPKTPESGAALAVNVGSWDDPVGRPGMAHFVEHMLFMGTKKYPVEEEYHRYFDEHGGKRNAFTANDRTVYIFSVQNEGFNGALDRFAQFFISPLFNASGVERESIAVDQEFSKNVSLDGWRSYHVMKELANPEHPFHNFSIGNRETLSKISREELIAWYEKHYSSDLMHLVVYSSEALDQLEKTVVELFSTVPQRPHQPSLITDSLLTSQTAGKMVAITPVQDLQTLELVWELPKEIGLDRETHVADLISYVLGHEGENSLLAQLKKESLATSLSTEAAQLGKNQLLLALSIQLTSQGIQKHDQVIARCFEALSSLKKTGIPSYIYDEIRQMKTLSYEYQEREDVFGYVSDVASDMVDEPLETYPLKTLMPTKYSEDKIHTVLSTLSPDKCHFTLIANPKISRVKATNEEKWMKVPYTLVTVPQESLAKWKENVVAKTFAPPAPNRFLPQNLTLINEPASPTEEPTKLPEPALLVKNARGSLYYCADDRFFVPEMAWIINLRTPAINEADPRSQALADLYCYTLKQHLASLSYEAALAGLHFSVASTHNGISLELSGYSEKATDLFQHLVDALKTSTPSTEEFSIYREQLAREYANAAKKTPVIQGMESLMSLLYKEISTRSQKEKAIKALDYAQTKEFCEHVLDSCYIEAVAYGNLSEDNAQEVWGLLNEKIKSKPYAEKDFFRLQVAALPNGKDPFFFSKRTSLPGNAVILVTDCGEFSFKKRAAQEILSKGLEEPFFTELRTKQQTGYFVRNWADDLENHLYSFFVVQSSTHDPRDLLARFELFLESSLRNLTSTTIPKERFESIRDSLVHQLQHPAEKMDKMAELLHTIAYEHEGDFAWNQKRIEGLKELSYEEFETFSKDFVGKENHRRLGVCVHGAIKDRLHYRNAVTLDKIRSDIEYTGKILPTPIVDGSSQ